MNESVGKIVEVLISAGHEKLAAELVALPTDSAKSVVIRAFAAELEKSIPALVTQVQHRIGEMIEDGDSKVLLDFEGDWLAASTQLAGMERSEADRKSAARDALAQAGETIGPIVAAIVRALVP